jgi:hypothetical protein
LDSIIHRIRYNQDMLLPAIVLPLPDPQGIFLPHLQHITPILKSTFAQAIINFPPATRQAQPEVVGQIETDPFFVSVEYPESPIGEHFRALYSFAARICPPAQVLHLCYIDRLAFALETGCRSTFLEAMRATSAERTPLIFQRSAAAWDTHPRNYRDIEGMVTRAGEWLFHRTLDFAWCHLAVQAGQLDEILPLTSQPDLSFVAELVLAMIDSIHTQEVDWLAWEDPFILGYDPQRLKTERENSLSETRKRLAYVAPMLHLLHQASI